VDHLAEKQHRANAETFLVAINKLAEQRSSAQQLWNLSAKTQSMLMGTITFKRFDPSVTTQPRITLLMTN
jgi:hypothetical protein